MIMHISGVSTVGPSGACDPLTFSLLIVILSKRVAYFLAAVIRV